MEKSRIIIDREKCIGCAACAADCVAKNIRFKEGRAELIMPDCLMCGHCVAVCPVNAVGVSGSEYVTEDTGIPDGVSRDITPIQVLELIRFRRSIRRFRDKEIPDRIIADILEAGRLTHTAKNMQDLSFVVLKKERKKAEEAAVAFFRKIKPIADILMPAARNMSIDDDFFFFKAPIVIVILAKDKGNGILAAQNMEFVAETSGLGVLYSGFFSFAANNSGRLKKLLGIGKGRKAAMTLVLGYPDVKYYRSAPRKKLSCRYM